MTANGKHSNVGVLPEGVDMADVLRGIDEAMASPGIGSVIKPTDRCDCGRVDLTSVSRADGITEPRAGGDVVHRKEGCFQCICGGAKPGDFCIVHQRQLGPPCPLTTAALPISERQRNVVEEFHGTVAGHNHAMGMWQPYGNPADPVISCTKCGLGWSLSAVLNGQHSLVIAECESLSKTQEKISASLHAIAKAWPWPPPKVVDRFEVTGRFQPMAQPQRADPETSAIEKLNNARAQSKALGMTMREWEEHVDSLQGSLLRRALAEYADAGPLTQPEKWKALRWVIEEEVKLRGGK